MSFAGFLNIRSNFVQQQGANRRFIVIPPAKNVSCLILLNFNPELLYGSIPPRKPLNKLAVDGREAIESSCKLTSRTRVEGKTWENRILSKASFICLNIYIYIYTPLYKYLDVHLNIYTYIYIYKYTCVYIYICVCVCACVLIIYIYIILHVINIIYIYNIIYIMTYIHIYMCVCVCVFRFSCSSEFHPWFQSWRSSIRGISYPTVGHLPWIQSCPHRH